MSQASAIAATCRWSVPQQPPRTRRRQSGVQLAVAARRARRIAVIELLRLVELGVAHSRGVDAEAAEPLEPRALEHAGEVRRVGAVDHEVRGRAACLGVDPLDRLAERLAARQSPVGLDRERDHDRHARAGRGARDADRLFGVGHRQPATMSAPAGDVATCGEWYCSASSALISAAGRSRRRAGRSRR